MRWSTPPRALSAAGSLIVLTVAGCGVLPGSGSMLAGAGGSPAGGAGRGGRGGTAGSGLIGAGTGNGAGTTITGTECGGSVSTVIPNALAADVLIVLDASAAMNDDVAGNACDGGCGAGSMWAQAAAAIDRLVADMDTTANWGLEIFPDPGSACSASLVTVPVGPGRAADIIAAIGARTSASGGVIAGGSAPISGAVGIATAYLAGLKDVSPKAILLATAGAPSCQRGASDIGADDSMGAVQAITLANSAGFATTVLGIATAGGPADGTLDAMAFAGGRARPSSPRYTPIADVAELTAKVDGLLGINPPCTFSIPAPPTNDGTTSRSDIGVIVDGAQVPMDPNHQDGWDYTDVTMTALVLYGSACQTVTSSPPHTVSIVFRCDGLE